MVDVRRLSAKELSKKTGKHVRWIQSIGQEIIDAGHGFRVGRTLVFNESAIGWLKNRPDKRFKNKK